MQDENTLKDLGLDAEKWAEAFCSKFLIVRKRKPDPNLRNDQRDEAIMLEWFTNAIKAGQFTNIQESDD